MRRPHLSILIGDCVCSHGQLHPGQSDSAWPGQELGVRGNCCCCNLVLINERIITDISCLRYDECCSPPGPGLAGADSLKCCVELTIN